MMSKDEALKQQGDDLTSVGAEQANVETVYAKKTEISPEEEIAGLSAEVERLQQELNNAKDQVLRAAAEAQNVRRRAELDVEKAHKFALERFARELLPVADSLEKAAQALSSAEDLQKEGVDMTLKLLMDVLGRFHIQQLCPQGEAFNPKFHEAMSLLPNPLLPANSVMDVLQKGYTLNERLLRPAMVVVSTGSNAKAGDDAKKPDTAS